MVECKRIKRTVTDVKRRRSKAEYLKAKVVFDCG